MTSTVFVRAHNAGPVKVTLVDPSNDDKENNPHQVIVPKGEAREFYIHSSQAVARIEEVTE